jgi:hypothetical protein
VPAVALVLAAAAVALIAWDYRLALIGLGLAYLAGGLLFVELIDPRLAVVYTLSGVFTTLILVVTAWQVGWGRPPRGLTPDEAARLESSRRVTLGRLNLPASAFLRAVAAGGALLLAVWLWRSGAGLLAVIPAEQGFVGLAILGLGAIGLAGLATSPEPFPSGLGLLVFLLGFDLFMAAVEQSIGLTVALAALNLLAALVISYLAQSRAVPVDVVV